MTWYRKACFTLARIHIIYQLRALRFISLARQSCFVVKYGAALSVHCMGIFSSISRRRGLAVLMQSRTQCLQCYLSFTRFGISSCCKLQEGVNQDCTQAVHGATRQNVLFAIYCKPETLEGCGQGFTCAPVPDSSVSTLRPSSQALK